jgi:hypothetical protein
MDPELRKENEMVLASQLLLSFQASVTLAERDLFSDVIRLAYEIKKVKDINSANAIAFLLDSTLSPGPTLRTISVPIFREQTLQNTVFKKGQY